MASVRTLTEVKIIIEGAIKFFGVGDCGLFNTPNIVGDCMKCLYEYDGITVLLCPEWSYFEVFGLNEDEWKELCDHYVEVGGRL